MAINNHAFEELVKGFSVRGEKPHGRLLTLSRYWTGYINAQYFNDICEKYRWDNRLDYDGIFLNDKQMFSALGFEIVDTMDYSDYQNAAIIHDLNSTDVSSAYLEKYDYILDAGTLEHVFNLPNALEAIFKMLKVGGTFIFDQPAYDGINHGFYNISPCLYYEYFAVNNYQINNMCVYLSESASESGRGDSFRAMALCEEDVRCKTIRIPGDFRCYLCGSATKTANTTYTTMPQQPCFSNTWEETKARNKMIADAFVSAGSGSVYLYGTGIHAINLIMMLSEVQLKVLEENGGMISQSSDEIGRHFAYNIKIYDVSIVKKGDIIIISSRIYQDIIYDRIKNLETNGIRIVKLY